jgi:hypothetical protein
VPLSLLPPLAGGESEDDRMNVKLESKHGAIDVGISLLDGAQDFSIEEAKRKRPTTLDIKSVHGSINVKLVCPSFSATSTCSLYQTWNSVPVHHLPPHQFHSTSM